MYYIMMSPMLYMGMKLLAGISLVASLGDVRQSTEKVTAKASKEGGDTMLTRPAFVGLGVQMADM